MASEMAMQFASQAWCQPETSNKEMDPTLCMAFAQVLDAWMEAASQEAQARIDALEKQRASLFKEGAEAAAIAAERIAELEGKLRSADGLAKFNSNLFTEQARRIAELERERDRAIQQHERCAEKLFNAERELAKQLERNKLLKHANSLFANSGDNDELAIDQLRRELAEARKDRRRLAAMMPLFQEARDAICYIPLTTAKLRGLDLTLADRMDMVGIKEKWEEYDAAMRQEGE